ncbi:hypothetical protein [Roseivirga sp. E12]|uniref:hypothetical protein n=1 Tax=Roseivirga sp. E12 TaxID=2819237 RepID=UPI001ABCADC9|nr:hypothetical protein [Roseivirga sp. E12]MBO3699445.1 hypothetical protein [Roseivirga sp. E12]
MSKREELKSANENFKTALESQLGDLKHNVDKIGKTALIVGGGLLGAYLLSTAFTDSGKKSKKEKVKRDKSSKKDKSHFHDNLLTSTLKEQAIVFILGLAAERLTSLLSEIDTDKNEK